jgi:hypothetical protein
MTSASDRPANGDLWLVVNVATRAPALAAVSAALTTPKVVPEPDATKSRSVEEIAGVVVSPATCMVRPKCISLIAAIRRTRPLRPAPATKIRSALSICAINAANCRWSILAAVSAISFLTKDKLRATAFASSSGVSAVVAVGLTILFL